MPGVLLQQGEILARELLDVFTQRPEAVPKLGGRAVHSQLSQLAPCLGGQTLFSQELELARSGVLSQLPVPVLPVSVRHPVAQAREVLVRQSLDLGLDVVYLRHISSIRRFTGFRCSPYRPGSTRPATLSPAAVVAVLEGLVWEPRAMRGAGAPDVASLRRSTLRGR
jgi:hypothetical protein